MRTYTYKIRTHRKNKRLGNLLDDLADVHNYFLRLEERYYGIYGKYAGRYRLQPHLTKLLGRTKKHWTWIPRDTLDAMIIRIHIAYRRFFDWLKNGNQRGRRVGPPKFKKKQRYRSAKFQSGYKIFQESRDGKPSIVPKGTVRLSFKQWNAAKQKFVFVHRNILYHHHREWQGEVRYIQILRDALGTLWLYVVTDNSVKEVLPTTGKSVGADFGINTYLTLNTGEKIHHPQPLDPSELFQINRESSALLLEESYLDLDVHVHFR